MVIRKIFNPSTNADHLGAWSPFSLNCKPVNGQNKLFFSLLVTKNNQKNTKIIPVTFEFSILWSKLAWTLIDVVFTSLLMNKQIVYHQGIIYHSFMFFSRIKIIFLWIEKKKKIESSTKNPLVAEFYKSTYIGGKIFFLSFY